MSLPVTTLTLKLYFASVSLVFVIGVALAVWGGWYGKTTSPESVVTLPEFTFSAAEFPRKETMARLSVDREPPRDIFLADTPAVNQEQELDIREISLSMVIVKGEKRYTLTNGLLLKEGEEAAGFTVRRIRSHGVWYQVGVRDIFLRTGDKIYVDGNGKIIDKPLAGSQAGGQMESPFIDLQTSTGTL